MNLAFLCQLRTHVCKFQSAHLPNQKLQICASYNLNWLLTIFRDELDAPGEAFYGLSTAFSLSETPQRSFEISEYEE